MEKAKRYHVLDWLRGLAIINMIIYHALWDVVFIFGVEISWYESVIGYIWQQSICWLFIFLSGFCHSFGKSQLKRGLEVFGWSIIISAVTMIFMREEAILFGVLTLIGVSMIMMIPLGRVFKHINPNIGAITFFLMFIVTRNVNSGWLGFGNLKLVELPEGIYSGWIGAFFGFPPPHFQSSDYFSLIPWIFLYITGYFAKGIFDKKNMMTALTKPKVKPLEWLGRHSLTIYILHQPIVYTTLYLIFQIRNVLKL